MPSLEVRVDRHAWKPFGHGIEVVAILGKILVSWSATDVAYAVGDVEAPINGKANGLSCLQWLWEIDTHHGLVDGYVERLA